MKNFRLPRVLVVAGRLLILLLLSTWSTGLTQEVEPEAAPDPVAERASYSTPRDTVRTFVEAMASVNAGNGEHLDIAIECLSLEELPPGERTARAGDLARKLYGVVDSATFSLDSIPEDVSGRTYELVLGDGGEIVLTLRRNDDDRWRFSYTNTLKNIGTVYEEVVEAEQTNGPDVEDLDPALQSPRDAMEVFLTGVNEYAEGGIEKAILALDLSYLGKDVREQAGTEFAIKLKRILDRHKRVTLTEVPNYPEGPPYYHLRDPAGNIIIDLVEDPETGTRAWKFTSTTLENLTALYDVYKDRPLAEGIYRDRTPQLISLRLRDFASGQFPFLLKKALYLENWQWIGLFVIVFLGMAISRFIGWILVLIIRRVFAREQYSLDEKLEKDFVRPIRIALMAWVWLLGLHVLGLPAGSLYVLRIAAKSVSAGAGVWAFYRLIDILSSYLHERAERTENKYDDLLVPLVTKSLKVCVVVFGLVFMANVLDWNIQGVLAGLGLGGLAFALAARETVANLFGSITILLDRPFQIGDWVQIKEIDGSVESVGIRSTRVRTFYNSVITVPNNELINATIDNYGARKYRRIKTMLAVAYNTPVEKIEAFCEGIRQLIREHPYTRNDYYHVYLNEFADHSLNVLLYCFVETPDWGTELREKERLYLDIIRLANRLGVEFAFPTQTLYVRPDTDETNGSRAPKSSVQPAAFGRREATRIVRETLGPKGTVPPPVDLTAPLPTDENADPADRVTGGEGG